MASAVRLIRSSLLSDVAQYAYAATAPAGARLIFLAGACPLEDDGSTAAVGDYAGQAARCIETLVLALDAAGATMQDVISTRVLVASSRRDDLGAAWAVVRDAFGDHDVPEHAAGRHGAGLRGPAGRDRGRGRRRRLRRSEPERSAICDATAEGGRSTLLTTSSSRRPRRAGRRGRRSGPGASRARGRVGAGRRGGRAGWLWVRRSARRGRARRGRPRRRRAARRSR